MYAAGDMVFCVVRKQFGTIAIVDLDEHGHPSHPGCESMIKILWEPDSENMHWYSLYWESSFEIRVSLETFIHYPGTITEQEKLAIRIKHG